MRYSTAARRVCQAPAYLAYRIPMPITELYIHTDGDGYYVCPRCRITLEREFGAYCDRCGQCLDWSRYHQARPIYARRK